MSRWTAAEDTILKSVYHRHGAKAVQEALVHAGHPHRTVCAVQSRARNMKLPRPTTPSPDDQVLDLIRDYRGMPLTALDVRDELGGMSHNRARAILEDLTARGLIASRQMPGEHQGPNATLYFDPTAEAEEAA